MASGGLQAERPKAFVQVAALQASHMQTLDLCIDVIFAIDSITGCVCLQPAQKIMFHNHELRPLLHPRNLFFQLSINPFTKLLVTICARLPSLTTAMTFNTPVVTSARGKTATIFSN